MVCVNGAKSYLLKGTEILQVGTKLKLAASVLDPD